MSSIDEATANMLTAYHELNGDIHILNEEPSPLDFKICDQKSTSGCAPRLLDMARRS